MEGLPEALYSAAQTRDLDRRAARHPAMSGVSLMERAGAAAFDLLRRRWPRARRVTVVCGPGNNGGDGYVVARRVHEAGLTIKVMQPADGGRPGVDAAAARDRLVAAGIAVEPFQASLLAQADVIVDALFGTGLEREIRGEWCAAIEAINTCEVPVLALDIPSGLHADSGRILGVAVRAAATVGFIGLKTGMFTGCGREQCGDICFDQLGVPQEVIESTAPRALRITADSLRGLLPARARHAHKGDAGRVLVIGGRPGMGGAARLAGEAAYRAGAGLVTIASHPEHAACLNVARPELIVHGISAASELRALMDRADVIAIGPGLGQDSWARELWAAVQDSRVPLVVDADALNLLAADPFARDDWVMTPHPGEAGRLLECSTGDIEADRFAALQAVTGRFGGVCVLKGSGTLVADVRRAPVWLCDSGNPGLASAGTGDVLTGVIAGLLAQGLAPVDAARLGVWCHASAADDASAAAGGERGMLAGDLFSHIRWRVNAVADR